MTMGIAAKLAVAAEACGYVQKDGNNAFHKYRYASAANILGHVNDALAKAGLAVVDTAPEVVSDTGIGKDRVVTVRMTLVVADTETAERATFRGLGSGMDAGDKAVMKAVTAATKYAWMGAFSISTGDDPEADEETDRRAAQSGQGKRKPDEKPAQQKGDAAPPPPPAELAAFYDDLAASKLPGDVAKAWSRHRAALAAVPKVARAAAWKAAHEKVDVLAKTQGGGEVWLRKALAEEDARAKAAGEGGPQ